MVEKINKSEEEWRKILTPEQYRVMREKDTEIPFSCELNEFKGKKGVYLCSACGLPLFKSDGRFISRTGWPSFFEPIASENIDYRIDQSLNMERTEVRCARCGGHLGHIFNDGPLPTGKRYCINGVTLKFEPAK